MLLADLDAERAVLGSVLLDGALLDEVAEVLAAADFSDDRHRKIFDAMGALRTESQPIDAITLANRLRPADPVSSRTYVSGLDVGLASVANAKHYARIVKDLSLRRAVTRASAAVFDLAQDTRLSADELQAKSEQAIFDASLQADRHSLEHIRKSLPDVLREVEARGQSEEPPGVLSGIAALDRRLAGLRPGELIILAGRVGMGKSALAVGWAVKAARDGGCAAIFSLEMTSPEISKRMLAARALVDGQKLRGGGTISQDEWGRLMEASAELGRTALYVDPSGTLTVPDIASKLRRLRSRQGNLRLVVVDYLQLMDAARRSGSRAEDVASVSRGLKQLAKDLSVPILALAQLSRDVEKNARRPMLSDLRESGSIEQDADAVIFIHPSDETTEMPDDQRVELIVGKQRHGPTGSSMAIFQKPFSRFIDIEPQQTMKLGGADRAAGEDD